jgi:uncharacterized protein (TIGR03118 family)
MNTPAAIAAKWSGLITLSVLGAALAACGGKGYNGGLSGTTSAPTASLSVNPTTITLGQSAKLTWSASAGTTCTASNGWTGAQQTTGTQDVTPTATGNVTYTLACSGAGFTGTATQNATLAVQAASAYLTTTLVEDFAGGAARKQDANLMNPWGLALGATSPMWVANNHTDTSTLYNGNGDITPLVVHLPASFDATGMVANATTDFAVTGSAPPTLPAAFIFTGESGKIAGWAATVNGGVPVVPFTAPDGAVYKGLAIANNGTGNFLYAADFHNSKVDVLNGAYVKQTSSATSFAFTDATLPAGYSPFGIQAVNIAGTTRIVVAYATHDAASPDDEAAGAGLGVVNLFDTNGVLLTHLVAAGGKLNAPWGIALAPSDFGTLSNALLVGNFGDGKIHGYDSGTGRYLGELGDGASTAFAQPGLWGILFGNDALNQQHATLFFAAGINDEMNGRYGRIDLGTTPPALGTPPPLAFTAPAGNQTGTVTLTATVTAPPVAIANVKFYVNGTTLIGTATAPPYSVQWDTTKVPNGTAVLKAVATDTNGNVNARPGSATVAN